MSMSSEAAIEEGRRLADRVMDPNLFIDAVQDKVDEFEEFVPMWMEAATDQETIDMLEKETGLTHRQVKRWQHMLRRDREGFEAKLVNRIWRHWMR